MHAQARRLRRPDDVTFRIGDALVMVDEADRDAESVRLRAVVDGVILGVCLGRLTPEERVAVVERPLRLLGASAQG